MEIIPYLLAKINLHWNLSFGYPSSRKCPHPSKFTKQEKTKKKEEIRYILWYYLITTKNKTKQKGANPSMAYSNTDTYKMKREILNFARNFLAAYPHRMQSFSQT